MERRQVILVAFYNKKALGVRYLEGALERAGYQVTTIFYKDFNSVRPRPSTRREAELFLQLVREKQPVLVGLSVMSSMYLDTVYQLMDGLVREQIAPLVCGGAYATMFPEKLLERGGGLCPPLRRGARHLPAGRGSAPGERLAVHSVPVLAGGGKNPSK